MNPAYFIFKGVNSKETGIIVSEMPPVTKSEKNIESIEVSGRNGSLHIDDGTYKSKSYKIKCVLMDESKLETLKALYDGTGTLELSTEIGREYVATIQNQIDFEKYLTFLKEFVLQFELQPFSYTKTAVETTYTTNSTFTIGGTVNVFPIITVLGTGTFTLNNTQVVVNESGITIDCDLMNCTKNNINKNDKVELMDFPNLLVGENKLVLGTGIESVTIKYKEGWY